ncbi:MAG: protein kinase [Thermoguttaceae bacterium]|nr:protein kinase [Thermoguttaceae bacterium]
MNCPEESVLRAFVLCELSEETHDQLEEHLVLCAECQAVVENFERSHARIENISSLEDKDSSCSLLRQKADEKLRDREMLNLPLLIPPYLLTEPLGHGGMGEIYVGEHQVLKRKFAIKLIRQKKLLSPEIVQLFHQEIMAAGQLVHPNIVSVTDAGLFDGTPYLVMELLEGQTLTEYVHEKAGKLSFLEAKELILQAACGLRCAHESGFIHCDVKPSNLWRMPDGTLKVLDLGLAHLIEEMENETTHQVFGTPNFMAPEQRVPHAKVDVRADIYALGCVFFYLLTGLTQDECISREISFPQVREAGIFIPRGTQQVLDRMTHPIASRRFESMEAVTQALRKNFRFPIGKLSSSLFFALGMFAVGAFWGITLNRGDSKSGTASTDNSMEISEQTRENEVSKIPESTQDNMLETPGILEENKSSDSGKGEKNEETVSKEMVSSSLLNEIVDIVSKKLKPGEHYPEYCQPAKQFLSGNPSVDFIADLTPQLYVSDHIEEIGSIFSVLQQPEYPKNADVDSLEYQIYEQKERLFREFQSLLIGIGCFANDYSQVSEVCEALNFWENEEKNVLIEDYPAISALLLWPYYLHGKYEPKQGVGEKIRAEILKLAEKGEPLAMFWLGCEQWYGMRRCPVNREEAAKWFKKAVETGGERVSVWNSRYFLGRAHDLGIFGKKDRVKALEYYQNAKDNGPAFAMLGMAFLKGDGVPKDEKTAVEFFEKSGGYGCVEGAYLEGFCRENGLGCEISETGAQVAYGNAMLLNVNYAKTYGIMLLRSNGLENFESNHEAIKYAFSTPVILTEKRVAFSTLEESTSMPAFIQ